MNRHYEQVRKFHAAAGEEIPSKPTMLQIGNDDEREYMHYYTDHLKNITRDLRTDKDGGEVYFRTSLVLEEIIETMEATTLDGQVDGIIDSIYILLGTLTKMGVKPERHFDIVANSNLAKILPDGTVKRHPETGKIMKPDGWEENFAPEPLIIKELEQQTRTAECTTCSGQGEWRFGIECPSCM